MGKSMEIMGEDMGNHGTIPGCPIGKFMQNPCFFPDLRWFS